MDLRDLLFSEMDSLRLVCLRNSDLDHVRRMGAGGAPRASSYQGYAGGPAQGLSIGTGRQRSHGEMASKPRPETDRLANYICKLQLLPTSTSDISAIVHIADLGLECRAGKIFNRHIRIGWCADRLSNPSFNIS